MDYRYNKWVNEPKEPPPFYTQQQQQQHQSSSTLTYFTQQAIRVSAGYVAPRVGNSLDCLQHQCANMPETISGDIEKVAPQFGNPLDLLQHQPINMHEAFRREIEKQRIREEIIAEEVARRRMLEFEVRREIMMERQLAKQSGEGFSPFSSHGMSFSPTLPLQHSDLRSIEGRIARTTDERMGRGVSVSGFGARNQIGRLDMVPFEGRLSDIPFHQRSVEPNIPQLKPVFAEPLISERKPSLEPSKQKDRIILLGNPNSSLSGAKRKAATPPVGVASKPPSYAVPKKNGKEDWSCALCQVSATSESGLNDHLRGKKHKSKEAALTAQRNGKSYSIGLFPKKPKTTNLTEAKDADAPSLPLEISTNAAQKKGKTKEQKKKKFKFWCETCKVGALSEKSMEAHRTGKKHVARLQELSGRGIATSTTKAESPQTANEDVVDDKQTETKVTDDVCNAVAGNNPEE